MSRSSALHAWKADTAIKKMIASIETADTDQIVRAIDTKMTLASFSEGNARAHRLDAGRMLLVLRKRIEAEGEAWWKWHKEHFARSRKDAEKLLRMASAPDPEAAIEQERAGTRARMARSRNGAHVRSIIDQPRPMPDVTAGADRAEPATDGLIDPATLSMSAREKLEAAIRQHQRKLEAEFEPRVQAECQRRLEDISLPQYLKELTELESTISNRKGVMDRASYRKIISCLHPDSRKSVSDEKLCEAFDLFSKVEKWLVDETQSPTPFMPVPKTYQELMEMRAKVTAARKAQRDAKRAARGEVTHRVAGNAGRSR